MSNASPEQNGASALITAAILQIPRGLFILTSSFGGVRSGALTKWVQPCSEEPPLVMVALANDLPIQPLIRDSRAFALCQLSEGDRLLQRAFATAPDRNEDPFVTLACHTSPSGSPIIERALAYLDCELVRHVDLDSRYRLYVGQVRHAAILDCTKRPAIEFGSHGSNGHPS